MCVLYVMRASYVIDVSNNTTVKQIITKRSRSSNFQFCDELMGPSCITQFPSLKNQVVLEPQHLVDVMTRIYDIPKNTDMKRKFSGQWKHLKNQGIADRELLQHAWEGFEKSTDTVTGLLVASGMLCPMPTSYPSSVDVPCGSPGEQTRDVPPRQYIVPCHLPRRSLTSKWTKLSEGSDVPCKALCFDFNPFLPPSLFHHIVVRVILHAERTGGMKSKITRSEGIFSFGDVFIFKLELYQRHNQLNVLARCKDTQQGPSKLLGILKELVTDVCSQYFKFLKFVAGPPCPNPQCPGAVNEEHRLSFLSSDSSNDEEDAESRESGDNATNPRAITSDRRTHIIGVDPNSAPCTLWCSTMALHDHPDVKQWYSCHKIAKCNQGRRGDAVQQVEWSTDFKLVDVDPTKKDHIAQMLDLQPVGVGNARHVARKYGMDELSVKRLQNCAGEEVLEFLSAKVPNLTVREFCNTLKELDRNDIVKALTGDVEL